jgi:hypothetical protein
MEATNVKLLSRGLSVTPTLIISCGAKAATRQRCPNKPISQTIIQKNVLQFPQRVNLRREGFQRDVLRLSKMD